MIYIVIIFVLLFGAATFLTYMIGHRAGQEDILKALYRKEELEIQPDCLASIRYACKITEDIVWQNRR